MASTPAHHAAHGAAGDRCISRAAPDPHADADTHATQLHAAHRDRHTNSREHGAGGNPAGNEDPWDAWYAGNEDPWDARYADRYECPDAYPDARDGAGD